MTRLDRPAPPRPLQRALRRLSRLRRVLVACDFDGTLAPLVARPARARVPGDTRRALRTLARQPGVRVAIVSGRALADLARRVRLERAWLAGSNGLETRSPRGRTRAHVPARRRLPRAVHDVLSRECARFPGAWLELKPYTLAAHHRALSSRDRARFVSDIRRRLRPWAPLVRLVSGAHVLEIVPEVGRDKATVLAARMRGMPKGAVIWFGDDTHDEPAHAWVVRHGGVAVVVGRRRSLAPHRLRSPAEVGRMLEWLWRAREAHAASVSARPGARAPRARRATPRSPRGSRGRAG